ncbi:MAG: 4-hydroxy-tetrahydrodipicolinate synthase [Proteobacteria bacterium]|nr:4-hydroxy-tetrahydrodipicolinate synthase [Pseudomonadota bacterium]
MFQGTLPAIVTPFVESSSLNPPVDYESLESLIEWQLKHKIDGIVVVGSTGEAATLSTEEKLSVIKRTVEIVNKRVPVIAGTGSNNTYDSLELTIKVKSLGVDGVLLVAPYYNKPTQEGLFQHFKIIAEKGNLPVVIYNIPGRSVVEISIPTIEKLCSVPNIVAIKQAVDSASKLIELAAVVGEKMAILAGDDPLIYSVMSVGGKGVISASATAFPGVIAEITEAALNNQMKASFDAQLRAMPYINAIFAETNPIPAKAALKLQGIIKSDKMRLPLTSANDNTYAILKNLINK